MQSSYLTIAETVLRRVGEPMTAREIMDQAFIWEIVPAHLYGKRQDRTLQARLAEDIARNRDHSHFYRVSPGKYFLKEEKNADDGKWLEEYYAKPRRKELSQKDVLTLDFDLNTILSEDGESVPFNAIIDRLSSGEYSYRPTDDLLCDDRLTAVHSFLVVHNETEVLSYRCGKFFPESDPLFGRRSIGLGGAVTAFEVDMLYESLFGIVGNAVRDLCDSIGLPSQLAEKARYNGDVRPWIGVVTQAHEGRASSVLHMVLSYRCHPEFRPTKAALSINNLRWIDPSKSPNFLDDYDQTSRFLLTSDNARLMVKAYAST